ncbi:MAG: NAD-dependent epimerase/dehydratase family protein [Proteobacteria bacterium]|nr:NAD-dependent epimerase/dehydratase family protein [Pseudomonadota bacterium]
MGTKENFNPAIKKALVTGGGGFVGKAIVKLLLELGVETRVIGRHRYTDIEAEGAECVVGDISHPQIMTNAARGMDIVFHVAALAGIWGPWKDYYLTNVVGTEKVIESCRVNKVPMLVYTSTPSVVFNGRDIIGGDEQLEYAAKSLCHYATSKVIAEKMVLGANSSGLRTCALRPHLIWGPGDPHLLPRLLASGKKKLLKRVGNGINLVDISYIDNVAHAHILAAKNLAGSASACGKAYFISQGTPVNLWNWINELFAEMAVPEVQSSLSETFAYILGGTLELLYGLGRAKNEPRMTRFLAEQLAKSHYFSIVNAQKDLGYEPIVSIEEGLCRTVQWLKTQ